MDSSTVDKSAIEARIPHRAPFLFVDRILEETAERILTEWQVPPDAAFFEGHYPGNPVLPGVIASEFVFQSSALLFSGGEAKGVPVLTKIEDARYKRIVRPGETITAEVDLVERIGPARYMRAKVRVGTELVLRIRFVVALATVDKNEGKD